MMKYLILFLVSFWGFSSVAKPILVVANVEPSQTSSSKAFIISVYKGQKLEWPNGERITVINQAQGTPIRKKFYESILGVPPSKKFYIAKKGRFVFRTLQVSNSENVIKMVEDIKNSIGYVYRDEYEKLNNKKKIRVLFEHKT